MHFYKSDAQKMKWQDTKMGERLNKLCVAVGYLPQAESEYNEPRELGVDEDIYMIGGYSTMESFDEVICMKASTADALYLLPSWLVDWKDVDLVSDARFDFCGWFFTHRMFGQETSAHELSESFKYADALYKEVEEMLKNGEEKSSIQWKLDLLASFEATRLAVIRFCLQQRNPVSFIDVNALPESLRHLIPNNS